MHTKSAAHILQGSAIDSQWPFYLSNAGNLDWDFFWVNAFLRALACSNCFLSASDGLPGLSKVAKISAVASLDSTGVGRKYIGLFFIVYGCYTPHDA